MLPDPVQTPRHHWFTDPEQYRVKVQTYTRLPPEVTVQRISFERDVRAYRAAYDSGRSSAFPRRARPDPSAPRDEESIERSQRRAKTGVRKAVTELAPDALVTLTTREVMPLNDLLWVFQHFTRGLRRIIDFEYVAVPERHPTNPDHLHIHMAYRGRVNISVIRRMWHIALEARKVAASPAFFVDPSRPAILTSRRSKPVMASAACARLLATSRSTSPKT